MLLLLEPDPADFETTASLQASQRTVGVTTRSSSVARSSSSAAAMAPGTAAAEPSAAAGTTVAAASPITTRDLSPAGIDLYKMEFDHYKFKCNRFTERSHQVTQLAAWIRKTVSPQIFNSACKPGKTLDKWYDNLKTQVGTTSHEELTQATCQYNKVFASLRSRSRPRQLS